MKVEDLTGAFLDYWVAMAEGTDPASVAIKDGVCMIVKARTYPMDDPNRERRRGDLGHPFAGMTVRSEVPFRPSTNWAEGGPIIERERDAICNYLIRTGETITWLRHAALGDWMRAHVASKFGEEVSHPKEGA